MEDLDGAIEVSRHVIAEQFQTGGRRSPRLVTSGVGFCRRVNRWDLPGARPGGGLSWPVSAFLVDDRHVIDGGRVELAGGDLDRPGGDGSPADRVVGASQVGGGVGGPGVAVGAGHGERQAVSCRSGSVVVGRNWIPVVRADVALCGRPRRRLGGQPGGVSGAAHRLGRAAWWRSGPVPLRWAGPPASRCGRRADGHPLESTPGTRRPRYGSAARCSTNLGLRGGHDQWPARTARNFSSAERSRMRDVDEAPRRRPRWCQRRHGTR